MRSNYLFFLVKQYAMGGFNSTMYWVRHYSAKNKVRFLTHLIYGLFQTSYLSFEFWNVDLKDTIEIVTCTIHTDRCVIHVYVTGQDVV